MELKFVDTYYESRIVTPESDPEMFGAYLLGANACPAGMDFAFIDPDGHAQAKEYRYGYHKAAARHWRAVMKQQPTSVLGMVTPDMAVDRDDEGHPVLRIQGLGWQPEGSPGQLWVHNPEDHRDMWFVNPEQFTEDYLVWPDDRFRYLLPKQVYTKVKVQAGILLSAGVTLIGEEGAMTTDGSQMFVMNRPARGDGQHWARDVIDAYVRYVG